MNSTIMYDWVSFDGFIMIRYVSSTYMNYSILLDTIEITEMMSDVCTFL